MESKYMCQAVDEMKKEEHCAGARTKFPAPGTNVFVTSA
jgi:hypothetical protein